MIKSAKSAIGVTALSTGVLLSGYAFAHPGHESLSFSGGLQSGFLHPVVGLDHLLVLCAVGALSASLTGIQRLLLPLVFVGLMLFGFLMAHAGWHLASSSTIETMIGLSLFLSAAFLVINRLMARQVKSGRSIAETIFAWGITGFSVFHGSAHGLEIPIDASTSGFGVGFISASLVVILSAFYITNKTTISPKERVAMT